MQGQAARVMVSMMLAREISLEWARKRNPRGISSTFGSGREVRCYSLVEG